MSNSLGAVIPVTGPIVGFPGNVSRVGERVIRSRQVNPTTANAVPFGAGVIEISNSVGGYVQSLADFLATAANAANLMAQFMGIAVREVGQQFQYTSLIQQGPGQTTVATTTTSGSTASGASTVVVTSATGLQVNQGVEALGIQPGTLVTSISGTSIGISLPTIQIIPTTTPIAFTGVTATIIGSYPAGSLADVLLRGSQPVIINGPTAPQNNQPVYVRTVANAALAGTSIGDFEAGADVSTTSITITTTLGSTALTTSAGTGLAPGQQITGPGIANNTFLVSGATTSWVMSQGAIAAVTGGAASFNNCALLGSAADPWIVFSTGQLDQNNVAEVTIKTRHAA